MRVRVKSLTMRGEILAKSWPSKLSRRELPAAEENKSDMGGLGSNGITSFLILSKNDDAQWKFIFAVYITI